jgi:hypothetical protein
MEDESHTVEAYGIVTPPESEGEDDEPTEEDDD